MAPEKNKAESGGEDAVNDEIKEVNDAKSEKTANLTEEKSVEKGENDEKIEKEKVVVEEEKIEEKEKEKEKETVTPRDRPARERKAVDRFWLSSPASRPSGNKPLSIEKGSGTPLKDIPNVAFKLSKRKADDNLQLLHTILFGKKAKAHTLKKDIGQFSGFVWTENEEKQRAKMKEKIDKCVKEKLLHFCDVLNIPINKSSVRKEDLTVKLLEFLESPHATTEELLADKDQKGKSQKGKPSSTKSKSSKVASAEKSAKKTQSGEKRKRSSKADEDIETDNKDDDMETQSHSSEDDEDAVEKQESDMDIESEEEKDESEEKTASKSLSKANSGSGDGKKSTSTKKSPPEKSTKTPAKSEKKTVGSSNKSSTTEASPSSSKAKGSTSKKQKVEEETPKEKPVSVKEKPAKKKPESKSASKEKGKGKPNKEAKKEPTNAELRSQAVNILKEVDFNTATLSDILRLLGSHFGLDLMHRKVEVKAIITDVIENMSDDDDDDEDDSDEDAQDSDKE